MNEKEELIKQLMEKNEKEFFEQYGYIMNSKQKKILKKNIEKIVNRNFKKFND